MFLVTSPIVINVPTRGLLAVETMQTIVQCPENLNIKRNMTSMFVNKKHRYNDPLIEFLYWSLILAPLLTRFCPLMHESLLAMFLYCVNFCRSLGCVPSITS